MSGREELRTALHLHHLTGCSPAPLAHYLKALGVLRILAEQKDPDARGFWRDEHFCLITTLDRRALQSFFLDEYAPSAVLNPWGARSGFYPGASEKSAREALQRIERTTFARLDPMKRAIATVRSLVHAAGGRKPDDEQARASFLRALRQSLRGASNEWLDTVVALVGEDHRPPALMGTGGNEGSGSYSSAFLKALVACILERSQDHALVLFTNDEGRNTSGYSWTESFGQFLPEGEASAWDLLLAFEGAIAFRSTIALRSGTGPQRFLSSPFYFAPHAVGSGTSARIDEFALNKGRENPGRGEQWFPLWSRPTRYCELGSLITEGRCSIGKRHSKRALEAARAVSLLGVARGIDAFVRYGYLQRNNLATHFAVPLGVVRVEARPHARLIDDVGAWHDRIHAAARKKSAPNRLIAAERRLADVIFAALTGAETAQRWQSVLSALTTVEAALIYGSGVDVGPIPPLSPEWLAVSNDGSAEWRLARALGSAAAEYAKGAPRDPVRHHWLPLEKGARRFIEKDKRLAHDPRVVMRGRDGLADFIALVERRVIEGVHRSERRLPLVAAPGCGASPADLDAFIAGAVDVDRVSALARAFMAIRWDRLHGAVTSPLDGRSPDDAWVAIRLACLPWPLREDLSIPTDEAIVRRLVTGNASTAVEIALRRLESCGLRPPIRAGTTDPATARRWAAALAFPIDRRCARSLVRAFESPPIP